MGLRQIGATLAEPAAPQTVGRRPRPPGRSEPLAFSVLGSLIRVTGAPPLRRAQLAAVLRPFRARSLAPGAALPPTADITIHLEPTADQACWQVFVNGDFVTLTFDSSTLAPYLEWLVISRAVERSTTCVTFHAASLAWRRRAIILIAPSGAGKTTLTAGLAARGWKPLADDLTVIDVATRAAHAFRRCFHADPFTRAVIESATPARAPVAALADYIQPTRWAAGGCEPTWLALVRRDPAEAPSLRPIPRAQAAGALFNSAIHSDLPRTEVARLSAGLATTISGCWELNNSDLSATLDLLVQTVK